MLRYETAHTINAELHSSCLTTEALSNSVTDEILQLILKLHYSINITVT